MVRLHEGAKLQIRDVGAAAPFILCCRAHTTVWPPISSWNHQATADYILCRGAHIFFWKLTLFYGINLGSCCVFFVAPFGSYHILVIWLGAWKSRLWENNPNLKEIMSKDKTSQLKAKLKTKKNSKKARPSITPWKELQLKKHESPH